MKELQSSEYDAQHDHGTQIGSSSWDYLRRGLVPGLIAGLIIGPCTTFIPFLFLGGQNADSFAFLFVWGICCMFGLGLGLFNGIVGGAVGGYLTSRFGELHTARIGGIIRGAMFTGGINVMVIAIMITTGFI